MRKFNLAFIAAALLSSFNATASPELNTSAVLNVGYFHKVQEMTIYGDIKQDIVALATKEVSDSNADLFIIDDINEDIEHNTVILLVSLYDDLSDGLVNR